VLAGFGSYFSQQTPALTNMLLIVQVSRRIGGECGACEGKGLEVCHPVSTECVHVVLRIRTLTLGA